MSNILLKNAKFIISQDEKRRVLENKSILIKGNKIEKVGNVKSRSAEVIDCSKCVVLPGLINMHTHVPMNLLRGSAPGLKLKDWLNEIFKKEAKLTDEDIYEGSLDALKESARSGVTTVLDMYFKNRAIYRAVEETGMRAFLGYGMIDLFDNSKMLREEQETKNFFKFMEEKGNETIKAVVSPHAPNTCSKELLKWSERYSKKKKALLTIHAGETKGEVEFIKKKYKSELTKYLHKLGYMKAILFHGIYLDYNYIARLKTKPTIVHCPSSNLKLESGILDINKVIKSGANLCLGTDGPASNNNLDLLEEMKIAAMLFKTNRILKGKDNFIDRYLLDGVTRNAAESLRINSGQISIGKLADLTILNLENHLSYSRKETIINNIIYAANSSDVEMTIVNGKIIFRK